MLCCDQLFCESWEHFNQSECHQEHVLYGGRAYAYNEQFGCVSYILSPVDQHVAMIKGHAYRSFNESVIQLCYGVQSLAA